jgi:hypothetical protein
MRSVSLRTASYPRRRHCSHSTSLILPSCVAMSLQVQMYRSVYDSHLAEPTCCTSNNNCPASGMLSPLTSGFRTSQGRLRAHSKRILRPPKGWSSGLSRLPRITWSRHQNLISNLDEVKYSKSWFTQNTTNLLSVINMATCFDS